MYHELNQSCMAKSSEYSIKMTKKYKRDRHFFVPWIKEG